MGNCYQQTNLNTQFNEQPSIILQSNSMIAFENQQFQQNLKQHQSDIPTLHYARKAKLIPKLYNKLMTSRQIEYQLRPINDKKVQKQVNEQATMLPAFFIYKFNAFYVGGWKSGLPHGRGKLYFKDSSLYQGQFINGQISSQDGVYFYADGSCKRGRVQHGKMNGNGVFYTNEGLFKYEGNWVDDKPNGQGKQNYSDGSMYQGKFVDGLKHDDHGTYKWANGKVYTGQFRDGYMEGTGKLVMPNGKGYFMGQFSKNLIVGHGKMKTQNGEYEGPFQNGLMHGKGTFRWYDQKVYQGQFDSGILHGNGKIYYPNGQIAEGIWHYGQNLKLQAIKTGDTSRILKKKYSGK